MNVGCAGNVPNADLLFPLPGLRNVIGGLHPHERVHLHGESLSTRSPIFPEFIGHIVMKVKIRVI
jgi:hypothetical protein